MKVASDLLNTKLFKGWLAVIVMAMLTLLAARVGLWLFNIHPHGDLPINF